MVYGADDAFEPVPEQVEVKATQLLEPFLVLGLGALVPAKCSAECLVN